MLPLAVEAGQLLQVVWVGLLAGIGATTVFSVVVLGGARSAEARRAGRGAAAALYAGLAIVAALVFAGGVVLAVEIMLAK